MDEKAIILEFLLDEEIVPTLKISKEVFGSKGTKKMVNPILYSLEKEGLIKKTCEENGSKPRWSIVEK